MTCQCTESNVTFPRACEVESTMKELFYNHLDTAERFFQNEIEVYESSMLLQSLLATGEYRIAQLQQQVEVFERYDESGGCIQYTETPLMQWTRSNNDLRECRPSVVLRVDQYDVTVRNGHHYICTHRPPVQVEDIDPNATVCIETTPWRFIDDTPHYRVQMHRPPTPGSAWEFVTDPLFIRGNI